MTRVALVFGGPSPEFEVSIVSARNVCRQLRDAGFETVPVGLNRDGTWRVGDGAFEALCAAPVDGKQNSNDRSGLFQWLSAEIDVVFPMIHGVSGEDGSIQGLCKMLGLAYVGGDPLNQSLCWDKLATRIVMRDNGIPQPAFVGLYRENFDQDQAVAEIEAKMRYPIFVKPSRTGSSIGVSRTRDRDALKKAIDLAFQYDYRVIVEQGLAALEIEIAGIGAQDPFLSIPGRIIPENDFYDFEEKYLKTSTQFEIPAKLNDHQLKRIRQIAKRAWLLLNCFGLGRIDFLVTPDEAYLNEINTAPGFTSISMYPRLLEKSGLSPPELMRQLVQLALDRDRLLPVGCFFESHADWYKE